MAGGRAIVMKNKGIFVVIEGIDGSGKGTQLQLLKDQLSEEGYSYELFDFPQYESESSYFAKQYLNGAYGSADQVGPYTASLFYALDRFDASERIKQALADGKVVIANRFVGSNMAHQGTKFDSREERRGYFVWLDSLEHTMLGIPRPDLSIVLKVTPEIAQKLVDNKEDRNYTDKKRDIHEADLSHLQRSVEVYDDMCKLFPKDFKMIDCVRGGKVIAKEKVHKLIWEKVMPLLPSNKSKNDSTKPKNMYVEKTDKGVIVTDTGKQFLEETVTNPTGQVYGFYDKLSPITIAAAMARLSRRGDDMRITILDEFASAQGKDEALLKRVITAYGDDSVQQLVGQHIVVEDASNLLTKKLEWGRLASYLEQSTRYIYFDQKDKNGKYKYFTPKNFNKKTKEYYEKINDQIFDIYLEMAHQLTDYVRKNSKVPEKEQDIAWKGATRAQACDAIRDVLPVSTKSTVGIFASGQALESLILHLMSDETKEAQDVGQMILEEGRKTVPAFLERADRPDRGGAFVAYRQETAQGVKEIADELLQTTHSKDSNPVELVGFWPKNELDLVSTMLYEYSGLSLREIKKRVDKLSYDDKKRIFDAYVGKRLNRRHKPGRALETAHYSWDIVCDYGIFRDLQRHRMVDDLAWQDLNPRFGYDVPKLVDEAGLSDKFEKCFDLSLKLYSYLQVEGYEKEAQYATLLGHKMRWKLTFNARQAFHFVELRTTPQGHPGYRKLCKEIYDKIAEVHPLIAKSMIFVNEDEDPELTRLAAERYTQWKLKQLDK